MSKIVSFSPRRRNLLSLISGVLLSECGSNAFTSVPPQLTGFATNKKLAPLDVCIVGAGLAGLTAAYELSKAGHTVTLFEGSKRLGGRVLTAFRHPWGEIGELGATFIPNGHWATMHYVQKFHLSVESFDYTSEDSDFFFCGRRFASDGLVDLKRNPCFPLLTGLTDFEATAGTNGIFSKFIQPIINSLPQNVEYSSPEGDFLSFLDSVSFEELLLQQGVTRAGVYLLRQGYLDCVGEGIGSVSALSMLRDLSHSGGTSFRLVDGSNGLVTGFENQLRDRCSIINETVVTKIVPSGQSVAITCSSRRRLPPGAAATHGVDGPAFLPFSDVYKRSFDVAICTIPFSIVDDIIDRAYWSKAFSSAKEVTRYTAVSRILFVVRESDFDLNHPIRKYRLRFYNISTDTPATFVFAFRQRAHPSLVSVGIFVAGQRARDIDAMSELNRMDFLKASVAKILNVQTHALKAYSYFSWTDNEFSRGAYAWFPPGSLRSLQRGNFIEMGRVVFAGEHVSDFPGWMQGAILSGYRAAEYVNDRVSTSR